MSVTVTWNDEGCLIKLGDTNGPTAHQLHVMLQALAIYDERNKDYNDNWVRMGWRGLLIRIRERADRLWDKWWDREQAETRDEDDALDLINFAAFFVRAQRNGMTTRDGQWWN